MGAAVTCQVPPEPQARWPHPQGAPGTQRPHTLLTPSWSLHWHLPPTGPGLGSSQIRPTIVRDRSLRPHTLRGRSVVGQKLWCPSEPPVASPMPGALTCMVAHRFLSSSLASCGCADRGPGSGGARGAEQCALGPPCRAKFLYPRRQSLWVACPAAEASSCLVMHPPGPFRLGTQGLPAHCCRPWGSRAPPPLVSSVSLSSVHIFKNGPCINVSAALLRGCASLCLWAFLGRSRLWGQNCSWG